MTLQFFQTIRGVEVEVFSDDWDGDPSVGIPYGPEVIYANRLDDGQDFPLTDEEIEAMTIKACEIEGEDDHV